MGKGLAAAARTAEVKFAARACLHQQPDPGRALSDLNRFLCDSRRLNEPDAGDLVSLTIVVIDTETGEAACALAAAEPPLVVRAGGGVSALAPGDLALGVYADTRYESQPLRLGPGDTLVMVTDGITEARSPAGDFLGYDGLVALARAAQSGRASASAQAILDGARRFAAGALSDDACLVVARRTGPEEAFGLEEASGTDGP